MKEDDEIAALFMVWYFREMPLSRIEHLLIGSAGACSGAIAEYSSYAEGTWFKHRLPKAFDYFNVIEWTHCRLPLCFSFWSANFGYRSANHKKILFLSSRMRYR